MKKIIKGKSSQEIQVLLMVLGIRVMVSALVVFVFGSSLPFMSVIISWPILVQIIVLTLIGIVIYGISGYMVAISKRDKQSLVGSIDFASYVLGGFLAGVFIAVFIYTYVTKKTEPWIIYSIVNPLFGNLVYEAGLQINLWNILWIISAVVPSIGMIMGMSYRLKQEGAE